MARCAGALTTAEAKVLRLVAAGHNATQVAQLLGRSPHTIRTHLRNISEKLETHGRGETLERARTLGMLVDRAPTST